jgi:xanthine/CO dehydrogenase XdhC/CoxF family maturation factor
VAIRDDGLVAGSVSGGCIEDDLIDKAKAGALSTGVPQVVRYGIDADAAHRFGLPCGGLIELVLEPVDDRTQLGELLQRLERGERVRRRLTLVSGEVTLEPAGRAEDDPQDGVRGDRRVDGAAAGVRTIPVTLVVRSQAQLLVSQADDDLPADVGVSCHAQLRTRLTTARTF